VIQRKTLNLLSAAGLASVATSAIWMLTSPSPVEVSSFPTAVPVDTTKEVKLSTSLCVQADGLEDWPIQDSMNDWNRNGKNILTFSTMDCDADIIIQSAVVDKEAWAATTFFDSGVISIALSPESPVEYRKHIICHEFAHVFGLPHTQSQSCSNIDLVVPSPSHDEVIWAGSGLWDWRVARSTALHGGR
jgi:hypothetical protein